jgi:hypothetical protein
MLILIRRHRHQLVIINILNLHLRILNKPQQMALRQIQDKEQQQQIPIQHHPMIILLKKQMLCESK